MTGYIGVNNLSKKISKMYIGVEGLSKKVNKAYIGVNNSSKLWYPNIDTTDPNTRYESKYLGTWSSTSDVDNFCSTYNHDNNYTGIGLGDFVLLYISPYYFYWEIAGFDMEYNRTASDGNVYNNGYGICWIPCANLISYGAFAWSNSRSDTGGYKSSSVHNSKLNGSSTWPYSNIKNMLGSHLVNRNVLLSSSVGSSGSTAYTWTTAYLSLISAGQLTGTFASHNNKYDDGEANYKFPVMNYESYTELVDEPIWLRNIKKGLSGANYDVYYLDYSDYTISYAKSTSGNWLYPMIYLR